MPIVPLPQFEEDLAAYLKEKEDRDAYERLNAPTTMVVRFGAMKMVGEFPYDGDAKPGCGSKLVVRTHRGEELGEMLTSTCPNSGCSKSVTRKEMLEYIENSGGKDYPFFDAKHNKQGVKGRVLRIATKEDMDRHAEQDASRHSMVKNARVAADDTGFDAKIVDAEPILGGGYVAYYYLSEQRIDHGAFLSRMKQLHGGERVEVRQVGARDEARLTADYERCGQHCCCKNFLKVLKPVSMRSAKVQKATLDPLKISGRCGRLMCCLRYEDSTYKELKKNLPHRKTRVGTPHGDGIVIDSQILTQLVLIELDSRERVAVAVEELEEPVSATRPETPPPPMKTESRRPPSPPSRPSNSTQPTGQSEQLSRGPDTTEPQDSTAPGTPGTSGKKRRRKRRRSGSSGEPNDTQQATQTDKSNKPEASTGGQTDAPRVKGRRRRKPSGNQAHTPGPGSADPANPTPPGEDSEKKPKPRRRKRRSLGGSGDGGDGSDRKGNGPSENGPSAPSGPSGSDA